MALVRAASLLGYPELVTEFGADPEALLRQAGIPPSAVADPESFIGFHNTVVAVETAASATGATDFGRQLARRRRQDGRVGDNRDGGYALHDAFDAVNCRGDIAGGVAVHRGGGGEGHIR